LKQLGLLILAGVLAAILAMEWVGWPPAPPHAGELNGQASAHVSAKPNGPANPTDLLVPLEDREQYAVIMERPLFLPDRRPPEEEPEEKQEQKAETDADIASLDLNAILISPGKISAWIRDPKEKQLIHVRPGDDVHGWVVHEILGDRLILERHGESDTLVLRDYKNQPPPVVAPTPPGREPSSTTPRKPKVAPTPPGRQPSATTPPKPKVPPRPGAASPRTNTRAHAFGE
jgi:general secretion pathway protein N